MSFVRIIKAIAVTMLVVLLISTVCTGLWLKNSVSKIPGQAPGLSSKSDSQDRLQPDLDQDLQSGSAPRDKDSFRQIAELLRKKWDLTDPAQRAALAEQVSTISTREREHAIEKAKRLGLPIELEEGDGALIGFQDGRPLYYSYYNDNAAISTAVPPVRDRAPFTADGEGFYIGLWDGMPLRTHQELAGRITVKDDSGSTPSHLHGTHVAGTLIAAGINPAARGMAPKAQIFYHDKNNDLAEMILLAAAAPNDTNKIYLSNHSYGPAAGWDGPRFIGTFSDDGDPSNDYPDGLGRYTSEEEARDGLAWNAPYYLMFRAAGNHRGQGPPGLGGTWKHEGKSYTYDPETHPQGDGVYKNGYDSHGAPGLAKNVMAVGNSWDAVSNGVRNLAAAGSNRSSSWGSADDGRIKPDIVANGTQVYSSVNTSDSDYMNKNGTSMSSPNACGSALLLIDVYDQCFPGDAMRSSTLKGLILHTSDDLGYPGPDYIFGWGMMNTYRAARLIKTHADDQANNPRIIEDKLSQQIKTNSYSFIWNGVEPITVTLCWTDPPGAGKTPEQHDDRTPVLIHDLNLRVQDPDGADHLPYVMPYTVMFEDEDFSVPAEPGSNHVDNVEQVRISTPPGPGTYTVWVDYEGVLTESNQNYSLIITGRGTADDEPTFTSPASVTITEGDALEHTLTAVSASAQPITFDAGSLPSEINLDAATGRMTAEASSVPPGEYLSILQAANLSATNTQAFLLTVQPSLGRALDQAAVRWQVSGDGAWHGQQRRSSDQVDAAKSPPLLDGESALLEAQFGGPGTLTFKWKVSSQTNQDELKFILNTNEWSAISGEQDWKQVSVNLPAGLNSVQWKYTKDAAGSAGHDRGWVDCVSYDGIFGFAGWMSQQSGMTQEELEDQRLAGFTAAPRSDRIPNGVAYAFELPLSDSDRDLSSVITTDVVETNTVKYLRIQFDRDPRKTDIDYLVKVSDTLDSGLWTGVPLNVIGTNGMLETVEAQTLMDENKKFMKIIIKVK